MKNNGSVGVRCFESVAKAAAIARWSLYGLCAMTLATMTHGAYARGVSPYLPLKLSPEIERQIERVLILADKPVLTRPIAAATVLEALPKACQRDARVCAQVRRFLRRYMETRSVDHGSFELAFTEDSQTPLPNMRGMLANSSWNASLGGHWQLNDHMILNVGGVAYEGDAEPAGTFLSVGFDWAQLDVGYRDHWFSPFTDHSMLISTNASTLPSITLSNYQPLTPLGLHYELFLGELSRSERIAFQNRFTEGHPRLAGVHVSMEPVSGWAIAANRLLQYGGGERDDSLRGLFNAFFDAARYDNTNSNLAFGEQSGNQQASFTSAFVFPGRTPFSVYAEYAGEDTFHADNFRLGSNTWAVGMHFPQLWQRFEFTYEYAEWQNNWYVHSVYGDGMTNDGRVLGHWGGDARVPDDNVGGESHMVQAAWEPSWGGELELHYRTTSKVPYTTVDYRRAHGVSVRYSMPWDRYTVGAQLEGGKDVFGESFGRVSGFVRYSENAANFRAYAGDDIDSNADVDGAERFVDTGVSYSRREYSVSDGVSPKENFSGMGAHIGLGARRKVSDNNDLGVRLEFDDVDGGSLIAIRVLDYRYRFTPSIAATGFLGAARYAARTPANGYYGGLGLQWINVVPGFDLSLEGRYAYSVVRNKTFPDERFTPTPHGYPNEYSDFIVGTLSLGYRF